MWDRLNSIKPGRAGMLFAHGGEGKRNEIEELEKIGRIGTPRCCCRRKIIALFMRRLVPRLLPSLARSQRLHYALTFRHTFLAPLTFFLSVAFVFSCILLCFYLSNFALAFFFFFTQYVDYSKLMQNSNIVRSLDITQF